MTNINGVSRSLFEAKVTIYPTVKDGLGEAVSLWRVLCDIQSGKYGAQVEAVRREPDKEKRAKLKGQLPCFTASGVFRGRKAVDLEAHSGFICIDLDAKDNTEAAEFGKLKSLLPGCPSVAYCARSAGGKGYFCLVPIADPAMHREFFRALCADFKKCGLTVDRSGADVGRKRFVSYDPEPYINTGAVPYARVFRKEDERPEARVFRKEDERPEARRIADGVKDKEAASLVRAIAKWAEENEFDLMGGYEQWFEMLCALASAFGEDGREMAHAVSRYGDYDPDETDRQFTECLKHGGYKYTLATFLHFARKGMGGEEYNRVSAALDFEDMLNDKAEEL